MPPERKHYIHLIPARSIKQGAIRYECLYPLSMDEETQHILNTSAFLEEVSDKYGLPDLSIVVRTAYTRLRDGSGVGYSMEVFSQFVPEDEQKIKALSDDIAENLVIARDFLHQQLGSEDISERQLNEMIDEGEEISETLQFAIGQVHEYAWYLTLVNYRLVFSIAKTDSSWKTMSQDEREDFFQDNLIAAWELACSFDPEKVEFSTFLYSSQLGKAKRAFFQRGDLTQARYQGYIVPYMEAQRMLKETRYADSPSMIELLASMLYDKAQGRLTFPESRVLEALEEYASKLYPKRTGRGKRPHLTYETVLNWTRPYKNFWRTVKKRIKRLRAVLNIGTTISLDQRRKVQFKDPETGEIRFERLPLLNLIPAEEVVLDKIQEKQLREEIEKILKSRLTEKEATFIKMRFGMDGYEEMTHQEIAEYFAVTREGIRKMEARVLRRLRHPGLNLKVFLH